MPFPQYVFSTARQEGGSSPPPPPPAYTTGGVVFDGATLDNASFVIANSPLGVLSIWFLTTSNDLAFHGTTSAGAYWSLSIYTVGSNNIELDVWDGASNTKEFKFDATVVVTPSVWNHLLIGVDTNHGAGLKVGKVTYNAVPQSVTVVADTDDAFDIGWGVSGETLTFDNDSTGADLADFWAGLGQYLDVSDSAVIAKFISGGKPVDLGSDGSTPTGTAPAIFLRRAPAAAASTFATNLGTGGNFTITGMLTNSPSSPSD